MPEQRLNAMQVAALLVSASYGIGFLFGSGEMALAHGMGASIYGVATAFGMLMLAIFSERLWKAAMPIWDMFGVAFGSGMKSCVALLSLIWMAGVLAAQIQGGVAIVELMGLNEVLAYAVVLGAVYGASRLDLRWASTVFMLFVIVSGLVLMYVLVTGHGWAIYLESPTRFINDLSSFQPTALLAISIAVVALVCTGGDYHQFVLAAKAPRDATLGCLLACIILTALSFLPAAAVLGLKLSGHLSKLEDSAQVIPFALLQGGISLGAAAGPVLLMGLFAAALGSGAAILRAMTNALVSAARQIPLTTPRRSAALSLVIGALLATRDQGIVATMVSVNVVYIGSIGVVFLVMLSGRHMTSWQSGAVMIAGLLGSTGVYVASWLGGAGVGEDADFRSLVFGIGTSSATLLLATRLNLKRA
jgi:SSS family solute:Na+ symporter